MPIPKGGVVVEESLGNDCFVPHCHCELSIARVLRVEVEMRGDSGAVIPAQLIPSPTGTCPRFYRERESLRELP